MRLKNHVKQFTINTLEVFAQNRDKNKIKLMFFFTLWKGYYRLYGHESDVAITTFQNW